MRATGSAVLYGRLFHGFWSFTGTCVHPDVCLPLSCAFLCQMNLIYEHRAGLITFVQFQILQSVISISKHGKPNEREWRKEGTMIMRREGARLLIPFSHFPVLILIADILTGLATMNMIHYIPVQRAHDFAQ